MRHLAISSLLLLLVTVFALIPASAAPGSVPASGVILQANRARLSAGPAATGSTVFSGDTLATDNVGTLQVRFGNTQAYFLPQSSVALGDIVNGFGGTLTGGTVILSSGTGSAFRLVADGATIRPASPQPTTAQITMVDAHELNLIASKGPLQISMDDQVQTLPEGSQVRMVVQPAASPASPQGGGNPAGRNRFLIFALALVGVGVGIGLWQALVSPSAPK